MLKFHSTRFLYAFLVLILASVACSMGGIAQPTQIPPTDTPLPTSTPKPTFTPKPTSTSTPIPTPTQVPEIGKPISSENWEITVFGAIYRDRIYPGGGFYYTPNPGYMFIDVGLKVKSLGTSTSVFSSDILIIDENDEAWSALWSGEQAADGKEVDPFSIGINETLDEDIDLSSEKYLRMMFVLSETSLNQEVSFKFEDVPAIPFTIEK
jgi:hypothetical protein